MTNESVFNNTATTGGKRDERNNHRDSVGLNTLPRAGKQYEEIAQGCHGNETKDISAGGYGRQYGQMF